MTLKEFNPIADMNLKWTKAKVTAADGISAQKLVSNEPEHEDICFAKITNVVFNKLNYWRITVYNDGKHFVIADADTEERAKGCAEAAAMASAIAVGDYKIPGFDN